MSNFHFYTYQFVNLDVWQLARGMTKSVYLIKKQFPKEEKYGLANQLRRSVSSVGANLAKGSGKAGGGINSVLQI